MFKRVLLATMLAAIFTAARADNLYHCSRVLYCEPNSSMFISGCSLEFSYWDCKDSQTRITITKYCYNHFCFPSNCECVCDDGGTGGYFNYCDCSSGEVYTRGFTCFCT